MIEIDPRRLLDELEILRRIGGCGTGVVRQALTPADLEARRWLATRCDAAGLRVVWDGVGNLFGVAPDGDRGLLIGSHSDTQPEGGWLDGAYGVICGLEVARAAREAGVGGVSCVAFSDEEGTFEPLLGSRFWTGALSLDDLADTVDQHGRRFGDVVASIPELRGAQGIPPAHFRSFIEPHIEQGPVLDDAREDVAVVTSIAGLHHIEVIVEGTQNHAGATPMDRRRDALQGFLAYAAALGEQYRALEGSPVWTFGKLDVQPNAVSIIPGRVRAVLQVRSGDRAQLATMLNAAFDVARLPTKCSIGVRRISTVEPALLDRDLAKALHAGSSQLGMPRCREMVSGALHDAGVVAGTLPSAMLFVPSAGGRSHCFDEDTPAEQLVIGAAVTAAAVSRLQA